MSIELTIKPTMHRWTLRDVMSRYRITNEELGKKIGRHETSVSRMRSTDTMPQFNGKQFDAICKALTEILHSRGIDKVITYKDLLEYVADENKP